MAEIKPNYDTKRKKLAEVIPLAAPFTVYIEQTKYCNFKCFYCIHSTRDEADGEFRALGHRMQHMDEGFYSASASLKPLYAASSASCSRDWGNR